MTPSNATGQPGVIHIDETATKEELSTPWNVIVHNDPINLMSYVAMVFMRVFGYPRAKAETLMLEVHNRGRSLVWSGGHEQAEQQQRPFGQRRYWGGGGRFGGRR